MMLDPVLVPPSFEAEWYCRLYPDAAVLPPGELERHWGTVGVPQGRRGNRLAGRGDFVRLVPQGARALEIGPYNKPLLSGPGVMYFDVLPQAGLDARAAGGPDADRRAPFIHFVSATGDLSVVDRTFDFVLSSHCVEHQPDLVAHLRQVRRVLNPGGRYYLLVPDCRYCFDHFIRPSTIADVMEAFAQQRTVHTLKSVIEHRVLTTHNDTGRHWAGDHYPAGSDVPARLRLALDEFVAAAGGYVDVHAWQFTPDVFTHLVDVLIRMGLVELAIEEVYPTRVNGNEFWAVLRAG